MLILFHGNDFKKARARLNEFIKEFTDKKPEASLVKIGEDNASGFDISGLLHEQGLFQKEILVVLDNVLGLNLFGEDLKDTLRQMSDSQNTFVFLEGGLDKKTLEIFKNLGQKTEEFKIEEISQKIFNRFSLGDGLGERNRKKLWLTFYQAIQSGIAPEEIHGILFWQIKSILIVKKSPNLKDSNLKPFVYGKAKKFSQNFSTEELKKLSTELVDLYHQSRKGLSELPVALEKFILKI